MPPRSGAEIVLVDGIEPLIVVLRGQRVMLDVDLARLYDVPTRRLNEQVKRNADRFPADFMFRLTSEEKAEVVANCDHLRNLKFSKTLPYAFTEHGALMAASVLNSPQAVEVSVYVVRAFVKLRQLLVSHAELAQRLAELERRVEGHDTSIKALIAAIRQLMAPLPDPPRRRIGFQPPTAAGDAAPPTARRRR